MKNTERYRNHQRFAVFNGFLLFSLVMLILQLWLFVSTLENLIDGKPAMAIPAAIASLVCLGVNIWMLLGVKRLERLG